MGTVFRLPDLGEGLQEAEIVTWHVGVGDHVVTDQPLVSIETDKAVVEVPSPQSGHIAALHAKWFETLCRVIDGEDILADPRFATEEARNRNPDALVAAVEEKTSFDVVLKSRFSPNTI